jgi:ubiquinol-cytochrome c reductase cytochrome b subunit
MDVKPKDAPDSWKPMPDNEKKAVVRFLSSGNDEEGKKIVSTRCTFCHLYKGEGDEGGTGLAPELDGYGSLAWVKAQIANPSSNATYRENALDPAKKGHMPRFDSELTPEDIDLLARWVLSQARGAALQ